METEDRDHGGSGDEANIGIVRMATVLSIGVALLTACGDSTAGDRATDAVLEPALSGQGYLQCDVSELLDGVDDFLEDPQETAARSAVYEMKDACLSEEADLVWSRGFTVLRKMESAIQAGTAGAAQKGANLANDVIDYLCDVDSPRCGATPVPVQASAFNPAGIFAVRGPGDEPAVASAAVPFTDFEGISNGALWGLETTATTWSKATGVAPWILFHGSIDTDLLDTRELTFGDLQFNLESFPDVAGFGTDDVHVGVCYETDVALPHIGGDESGPTLAERLLRHGTLLEAHTVGCDNWWPSVDSQDLEVAFRGAVALLARAFLPQPLAASLMTDRRAPSTGGTPIDFSPFAPVAISTFGSLRWVVPPVDGFSDRPLDVIVVEAVTGMGTPIERVGVTLHILKNRGEPAGASFCPPEDQPCDAPAAETMETLSGFDPVATFDGMQGDEVQIWKPGGYTICARGALGGFTFEEACEKIHIKKTLKN